MKDLERTSFTGWFRPLGSDRWEPICNADTEARCWTQLLNVSESSDKVVLRAGRHPWDRVR